MFNTEVSNLIEECEYAETQRDMKLTGVDESLARCVGPDRAGATGTSPAPANKEHEFKSYLDSVLAFDNPVAMLESPLVSKQDEVLALEVGLNRWIKASKLRQVLRQAATDFAFAWAVLVTSEEPDPAQGEIEFKDANGKAMRGLAHRPYTKRISFKDAFRDPLATSPWDMRFAGHSYLSDHDDVIQQAEEDPQGGWFIENVRALAKDADLQRVGRKPNAGNPSRNEVALRDIWVPDAKIDWEKELPEETEKDRDLYHGVIFTLGYSVQNSKATGLLVRRRPFFGPRWGPYTFIGAHVVTDDPFFQSPLQPARSAITRLNRLNDVGDAADANYKRLIFVNSLIEDLAQLIKNGKHDHVFDLPGYEKGMAEALEMGGRTNQMMLAQQIAEQKVDMLLGMGDVQRGAVTGEGSATETALASEASGARMASLERAWRSDGVSQMLLTPAWYICHDRRVRQPISLQEFKRIGGNFDELLRVELGPDGKPKLDADGRVIPVLDNLGEPIIEQPYIEGGTEDYDWFDSLDLSCDAWSMRRMSEATAQAQAQFLMNYTVTVAPLIPTMPWWEWDLLHRTFARLTGIQEMRSLARLDVAGMIADSIALIQMHERQLLDDSKATGATGQGKPVQPPAGPQAMAKPQAPMQAMKAPGGAQNAPGGKPAPLPGRSAGGQVGNQAAKSAGAAA